MISPSLVSNDLTSSYSIGLTWRVLAVAATRVAAARSEKCFPIT